MSKLGEIGWNVVGVKSLSAFTCRKRDALTQLALNLLDRRKKGARVIYGVHILH
jgi:hypothetical protein